MDEVSFGSWTLPKTEWAPLRDNVRIPYTMSSQKVVKAIVGISHTVGLEPSLIFYDKLNSDKVCEWVDMQDLTLDPRPAFFLIMLGTTLENKHLPTSTQKDQPYSKI